MLSGATAQLVLIVLVKMLDEPSHNWGAVPVSAGLFRNNLFSGLSVFPPIRERINDVPLLTRFFIERFCRDLKKAPLVFSPAAEKRFAEYSWSGNVRELQNYVERAVTMCDGAGTGSV